MRTEVLNRKKKNQKIFALPDFIFNHTFFLLNNHIEKLFARFNSYYTHSKIAWLSVLQKVKEKKIRSNFWEFRYKTIDRIFA